MVQKGVHFLVIWLIYHVMVCEVSSLAVMSVDLGSEWMKVGIVSPGVPMEIALNKESKRKTPAVLSFRENTRLFGEDALNIGVRFPKQAFGYLLDLLGKGIDHPLVKLYRERFPYYDIIEDPERGTILFKLDEETFYSPEELIAQMLVKAREFAENGAHQPIKECVITVPGFFNQVERKALLQAAELAGLKVLQLVNDYTAVAINYGIFRSKTFNETSQYVIFFDMGASSTTATLVSYQTIKTKEKGYVETLPQASVLGVGYDRTLGGLEMQVRLRDYLAKKFNDMKKTKTDIFTNARAMAKLFKEASRLKTILSANAEHYAQVENLLDEQDFKLLVKREEMETLCQDLFERVKNPVEQALGTAHLTIDLVSQVILVGAGTRVPKVQEYLQKAVGRELAKNLNTDEAATMGAVYRAADLSTGFKVSKFITKDAVLLPIQVTFNRATDDGVKQVKRTLFGLMNPYPQKKIITFNKHSTDFSFNVNYADLDYLPLQEVANVGATNLSQYVLTGVEDALKKNAGENTESKGIKAHFAMDDSGLLSLHNVELVVEKTVSAIEDEKEGPLSKIGSTITKLFGGDDNKLPLDNNEEGTLPDNVDDKPKNEEKVTPESSSNETAENATAKEATKDLKPKIVTIKEPIKSQENILSIQGLDQAKFSSSLKKLQHLENIEKEINRRATALNNLESFVIDIQNKLLEEEYIESSTQEELKKIEAACAEISEWLYEDGSDAGADTYEKKHDDLHSLTKELFSRVWEHKERPEALKALHTLLNQSSLFLENAKNLTKSNSEKDIFTDVEIDTLNKVIVETTQWRDNAVQEQESTKKSEPVKLSVKMIVDKMAALDREVKYLVNKAKLWKPKKIEKVKERNEENSTKIGNDNVTINEETIQASEESDNKEEKVESDDEQDTENHLEL